MLKQLEMVVHEIQLKKPLILNITNYVTMDFMANSLLALGAAPLMSLCVEELEELVQIASAININIGTLDQNFIALAHQAVQLATQYHKPIILDPVGAGASKIRTITARELAQHADIIKGNASEIMSLLDQDVKTHGVESTTSTEQAKASANFLSKTNNCTVVISGAQDFITNAIKAEFIEFGTPLMTRVTGMGCVLTAVIAVFKAVISDAFTAAKLATAYFNLCGNLAAVKTKCPGTFRTVFIDELFAADFNKMQQFITEESCSEV